MSEKVIYEKRYPKFDPEKELAALAPLFFDDTTKAELNYEQFMEKLFGNAVLVPIPGRRESKDLFIRKAIELSQLFEIDIEIVSQPECIHADYSFETFVCLRGLGELFAMADEFSFFQNADGPALTLSLRYYTHRIEKKTGSCDHARL